MKRQTFSVSFLFFLMIFIASCASQPCRQLRNPELATQKGVEVSERVQSPSDVPSAKSAANERRVLVAKADGSLQCGVSKGMSPEAMEKELKGIRVFSREKRPDGLMHIQVCGQPTGMLNVYEILEGDLAKAEARGFKKFTPN